MTSIDLTPQSERLLIRPGDSWVLPFLFRKFDNGNIPIPLDVSAYDQFAVLKQLIDGQYVPHSTFVRKPGTPTNVATELGIYLNNDDPSKITFVADWKNNAADIPDLAVTDYRLDFSFATDNGYDRSYFSYYITLTEQEQPDTTLIISGTKYILIQELVKEVKIYNTII